MKYKFNKQLSPIENIAIELNHIANELARQHGDSE